MQTTVKNHREKVYKSSSKATQLTLVCVGVAHTECSIKTLLDWEVQETARFVAKVLMLVRYLGGDT